MSSQDLPRTLSVRRAAVSGSLYEGEVGLAQLPRVAGAVIGADQRFQVRLQFAESESGKRILHAQVTGQAWLECQRCLQPVLVALAADSRLTIVAHDDEARASLREHDPLVVPGNEFDTYALVEDEILLALPIVALHESSDCPESLNVHGAASQGDAAVDEPVGNMRQPGVGAAQEAAGEAGDEPQPGRRANPFAVLGRLRAELQKNDKH